ncbi:MAG: hypothetical protein NTW87_01600 [Planctomycetota bacterium]|nr:hypothetical protein [Planctomycetota bacterium]
MATWTPDFGKSPDYGRFAGRGTAVDDGSFNLFERRMAHWAHMFDAQRTAILEEVAKATQAGLQVRFDFDMTRVESIKQESLAKRRLTYEAFDPDPAHGRRLLKIGELALTRPQRENKWCIYTGLLMSKHPTMNPVFLPRYEPAFVELPSNTACPMLPLLPDMFKFADAWALMAGTKQDVYAAAILARFPIPQRPSCAEVAVALMEILLYTT